MISVVFGEYNKPVIHAPNSIIITPDKIKYEFIKVFGL